MGIKIGDSTNYIEIANGTLTMAGTTTVFDGRILRSVAKWQA